MNLNQLFYPFDTPEGKEKTRLLTGKVISPVFSHRPRFRISWEAIMDEIENSHQREVDIMASAKANPELAKKYDAIAKNSKSPTEIVFSAITERVLPALFPEFARDWKPLGVDADILLQAEDEMNPWFRIEIFPRTTAGKMVRDFGSRIKFEVPMTSPQGGTYVQYLVAFIKGELAGNGLRPEEIGNMWTLHQGLWPVTDREIFHLFLWSATFSHIEHFSPGSKPMILGGTTIDCITGDHEEALMRFAQSK